MDLLLKFSHSELVSSLNLNDSVGGSFRMAIVGRLTDGSDGTFEGTDYAFVKSPLDGEATIAGYMILERNFGTSLSRCSSPLLNSSSITARRAMSTMTTVAKTVP